MQPETNGIRTWQWIVTVLVIAALILLGYKTFRGDEVKKDAVNTDSKDAASEVSKDLNRVVVTDQFPGNVVYLSSVQLSNPGFVVVKKDNAGTPGDIIGSQYFDKGINPGKITLKTPTVDAGMYYAVLYADTDSNKVFDAAKDMPLKDEAGNVIMKPFRATSTVSEVKG